MTRCSSPGSPRSRCCRGCSSRSRPASSSTASTAVPPWPWPTACAPCSPGLLVLLTATGATDDLVAVPHHLHLRDVRDGVRRRHPRRGSQHRRQGQPAARQLPDRSRGAGRAEPAVRPVHVAAVRGIRADPARRERGRVRRSRAARHLPAQGGVRPPVHRRDGRAAPGGLVPPVRRRLPLHHRQPDAAQALVPQHLLRHEPVGRLREPRAVPDRAGSGCRRPCSGSSC